jgi:hypothetical protein
VLLCSSRRQFGDPPAAKKRYHPNVGSAESEARQLRCRELRSPCGSRFVMAVGSPAVWSACDCVGLWLSWRIYARLSPLNASTGPSRMPCTIGGPFGRSFPVTSAFMGSYPEARGAGGSVLVFKVRAPGACIDHVGFPTEHRQSASVRSRLGKHGPIVAQAVETGALFAAGEGLSPFPGGGKACEDAQWPTERPGLAPAQRADSLLPGPRTLESGGAL